MLDGGVVTWQRVAQRNRNGKEVPTTGVTIIQHVTVGNETDIMHISLKDSKPKM